MTLYDDLIKQILNLLPENGKRFSYKKSALKQGNKNDIILSKDASYELGGSQKPCVTATAVTSAIPLENEILLYGKDLYEINSDIPFGKIILLEIEDIDEDEAYDRIKEMELVRYKFCPDGFMSRASALNMREQIRVSKKAVKSKVSFADYGSSLIEQYLKISEVKHSKIIFLTEFDKFDELYLLCDKIKNTTSALNRIMGNILFDCSSCNLKPICDEVDGMRELHRKKAKA